MDVPDSDRAIVEAIQHGERQRLTELYERHRSALYGFLLRSTGARAAADDLFQEVWMKVMERLDRFDPDKGAFRSWLFRVASNTAIDRVRYEALRSGPELDAPVGEEDGARRIDLIAGDTVDPERGAAALEGGTAMARALVKIPERQRQAVLLRHQQGMSYAEIADALGAPEGTAKALVHRGVHALRAHLEEYQDGRTSL